MKKTSFLYICILCVGLVSCDRQKVNLNQMRLLSPQEAFIYPDYTDITLPCNIAPLNFYVLPPYTGYSIKVFGQNGDTLKMKGKNFVKFNPSRWRSLLQENRNGKLWVNMDLNLGKKDSLQSLQFYWDVRDSIDSYLMCRLIEPSYQMSNVLQSIEYNLQTAEQRVLFDNRLQVYGCENCHTVAQGDGSHIMYHVRFNRTGTFIVRGDQIKRVNLASSRLTQGGTYPAWHPNKKMIAYSTSKASPLVHRNDIGSREEVFDSMVDIIV